MHLLIESNRLPTSMGLRRKTYFSALTVMDYAAIMSLPRTRLCPVRLCQIAPESLVRYSARFLLCLFLLALPVSLPCDFLFLDFSFYVGTLPGSFVRYSFDSKIDFLACLPCV